MLEVENNRTPENSEASESKELTSDVARSKKIPLQWAIELCILVVMSGVLLSGATVAYKDRHDDMSRYQCYALAFWHGLSGINSRPKTQCIFLIKAGAASEVNFVHRLEARGLPVSIGNIILKQDITGRLRVLPPEYPLLTVVPFTVGLFGPSNYYKITFALGMIAFTWGVYFVLRRSRSRAAAIAFADFMAIGAYATGAARFDIIVSGLTLLAVLCAGRSRWRWAFALLALATMIKFYPLILVPPFVIAQQMQAKHPWLSWQRWKGLAVFTLICSALLLISVLLNVQGTLGPFSYFSIRPIQVESFPATLAWLGSFTGGSPIHVVGTFDSVNIIGGHTVILSKLSTLGLAIGLLAVFYFQLRGKLDLIKSCLLTLLVVIVTGKVFSPQYLIWVTPMVAYVGMCNWRWLLCWGSIGLLTTSIYPFLYRAAPHSTLAPTLIPEFYPVLLVRNFLILGIVCALMYQAARIQHPQNDFLAPIINKIKRKSQPLVDFVDTQSKETPTGPVLKV